MPCITPWGLKNRVRALVAGAGARALGHGVDSVGKVLLLDGHGGDGSVEGATVGGRDARVRAACSLAALAARGAALGGGGHGRVEGGELGHHALVLVLLVGVDGLGMLAEVVETGELLSAVAGEGPLAGMFPGGTLISTTSRADARGGEDGHSASGSGGRDV